MTMDWTGEAPRAQLLAVVKEALRMNEPIADSAEAITDSVIHNFVLARIRPYKGYVEVIPEKDGYVVVLGNDRWFIHERDLGDLNFKAQASLDYVATTIAMQRAAVRAARAEQAKKRGRLRAQ